MRKCLLHIGGHKTGTSALQKALALSSNLLNGSGWFYSISCKHSVDFSANKLPLSIYAGNTDLIKNNLDLLESEIQSNNLNMILSSELLEKIIIHNYTITKTILDLLNKYFDSIDLVYCIRDPIDWYNSIFKQKVANPDSPYRRTIQDFTEEVLKFSPSILDIITAYKNTDLINDIHIYWYSKSFVDNLRYLLYETNIDYMSIVDPGTINSSLDGKFLAINYYYNQTCKPQYLNRHFIKKIRELSNKARSNNPDIVFKNNVIPEKYYQEIINIFYNIYSNIPTYVKTLNTNEQKLNEDYGIQFKQIHNPLDWHLEISSLERLGYDFT